jgi:hypothetical protein
MNCGCVKNLGCFAPNQTIDFGINAPFGDDYLFQIFGPSGYSEQTETFGSGDPIQIPFTFNENASTIIKIKIVTYGTSGLHYLTTEDGACSFEVNGLVPTC